MPYFSLHQKVHLLVDFLMGMRLPEPYEMLVDCGWSAEQLDRGWRLVEQAGRARFSEERITADRTNAELLEFKNRWFPVVRLVLGKRKPRITARLIGSYDSRSQGSAGFLVEPFLSTLSELEASDDPEERAARELLRERGLSAKAVATAARLVEQSRRLIATKPPAALLEAEARAEVELWDFYQEWAGLARRAITNRNLLRSLGLNKGGRPSRAREKEKQIGNAPPNVPKTLSVEAITPQPTTKLLKEYSHEEE